MHEGYLDREAARHLLEATMDVQKIEALLRASRKVRPAERPPGWLQGWLDGWEEGWAQGRQEGREEVLRCWVLDMCEMLGIEVPPTAPARVEAMREGELEALRRELKQTRCWPG
ncbi:MAG TPA: hypothetical protein VFS00_31335 [Polyangiaceae bacterium]|nr:hypothetical protein [Polyangiaceae bacterium]